ncbi:MULTISPECIES: MFS transporter [Steroidobacteraceae]|uniref:MFS transporter n=1 Tax=Steroidobacteraceae TaxID=2689614 RepID=UPI0018E5122C|nr:MULTISPECIES: MFS transporter [Steroidobacteraceae]
MHSPSVTRRSRLMLVAVLVTVVINYLDRTNISIAAIGLAAELALSPAQMGLLFSAFAWSYSLCQLPGGILADRVRPRVLYPALLVCWSLATLAQGMAASFAWLVVCRVLVGIFEAPSYPINNRVVSSWFVADRRAGAIGIYTSGQFLGLAGLAPVLVAFQATFGWRALFFACGAIGILWAWVWHSFYRDPDQDSKLTDADLSALRSGGALLDWKRPTQAPRFVFVASDLKHAFSHRALWGLYCGQFCIGTLTAFFLTWFPSYLVQARGMQFESIGAMTAVPFLAAMGGVVLAGLVSDWLVRNGVSNGLARKAPVLTGMALSGAVLAIPYVGDDATVLAIMAIAFFGNGLASINWVFVSMLAPPGHLGLVGGVFNLVGGLSAAVTPIAIGMLVRGGDFSAAMAYIGAVGMVGFACYTVLMSGIDGRLPNAIGQSHP